MNIQTSGIQCRRNRRRENAPTEVARTGHRRRKGRGDNPTPALPSREGERDKAAFPIRQDWRIQKKGNAERKREGEIEGKREREKGRERERKGEKGREKERGRKRRGRGEGNRRNTGENRTYTENKKSPTLRERGGFWERITKMNGEKTKK